MTRARTTTTDADAMAATGRALEDARRKAIAQGFRAPAPRSSPV